MNMIDNVTHAIDGGFRGFSVTKVNSVESIVPPSVDCLCISAVWKSAL